jgi:hypothetical protein
VRFCGHPAIAAGVLLPGFHTFYWMGLNATVWPNWKWLDGTPNPNATGRYQNWGYYMPQNILEPNNIFPPELCVGANFSEKVNLTGNWGWADTRCNQSHPYVCKTIGELQGLRRRPG